LQIYTKKAPVKHARCPVRPALFDCGQDLVYVIYWSRFGRRSREAVTALTVNIGSRSEYRCCLQSAGGRLSISEKGDPGPSLFCPRQID